MTEKCQAAAISIENLGVLNYQTVSGALSGTEMSDTSRLIVTDHSGMTIYDSALDGEPASNYALLPEIIQALSGNDI